MKLEKPKNPNYAAIVVEIKTIIQLEGCDNVQAAIIFGNQVIVSNDIKIGDVGIYFPLECQLSSLYLKENNLYRKKIKLNNDPEYKGGYFDENGRVKCVKFLKKHKSEGLYMPIDSVSEFLEKGDNLYIGDEFDSLNGVEICCKYVIPTTKKNSHKNGIKKQQAKKQYESKLIDKQFRFHDDTKMLYKNLDKIKPNDLISITYKMHGTSGISSYVLCKKKLSSFEKLLYRIGVNIKTEEYDYIYSSRKVIKNEQLLKNKTFQENYNSLSTSSKKRYVEKYYLDTFNCKIPNEQYRNIFPLTNIGNSMFTIDYFESKLNGFKKYLEKQLSTISKGYYGEDIWGIAHKELETFLQKGMTFYYEIVGFLPNGGMIQKGYEYGCEVGKYKISIYRITQTNIDGKVFEFSAKQVQDFCKNNGLNAVPELFYGRAKDILGEQHDEINFSEKFLERVKELYNEKDCYLCKNKVPEEGCVIRVEGYDFEAYKAKSNRFYERETILLDKGESNIEDEN